MHVMLVTLLRNRKLQSQNHLEDFPVPETLKGQLYVRLLHLSLEKLSKKKTLTKLTPLRKNLCKPYEQLHTFLSLFM